MPCPGVRRRRHRAGGGRRPFYTLCFLHASWVWLLLIGGQVHLFQAVPWPLFAALALKLGMEFLFALFLVATVLKSMEYAADRRRRAGGPRLAGMGEFEPGEPPAPGPAEDEPPPLAVLYLCCGDLDEDALSSLAKLRTGGPVRIWVHDDLGEGVPTRGVRAAVRRVEAATGRSITVLSRPRREGGKPGAVNYVLHRLPADFRLLLLADNDSRALSSRGLPQALARFRDPWVAAVQFRNTGILTDDGSLVRRSLAATIDVFDVFATHQSRHGFMPFLGHNGIVRLSALQVVGGLTPGMLSDDIDLSIRLALAGYRIEYAPEVAFGETVPPSYAAFRTRAYKWAVGCVQVLRRHFLPVITTRRLSLAQKLGFMEFAGFYVVQVALVAYLLLAYIVLPPFVPAAPAEVGLAFLAGTMVTVAILLPVLIHGDPRRQGRFSFAWRCAVSYGSLAAATTRGVITGAFRGRADWVPTNRAGAGSFWPATAPLEVAFGLLLFITPFLWSPVLLAMPSTYLFASNFLFVPVLAATYRPLQNRRHIRGAIRTVLAAAVGGGLVVVALALATDTGVTAPVTGGRGRVTALETDLLVDGEPFRVKGIHYSPYPPRTGPKHGGWPGEAVTARDFRFLDDLGVNTILVHDAPVSLLDRAAAADLMVIHAFTINWQSIHDDAAFQRLREGIQAEASARAGHPALLYYLVGNEIQEWIFEDLGAEFLATRLAALADAVREADPGALISHANWPPTKSLPVPFLDVVSFNLYPAWPREVVVTGYGRYIETVLRPLAGSRPLVITEFGQNSLEAGEQRQAEVIRQCWREIRTRTAGGVVFAFADEWWKNYNNPVPGGDFWEREYAPEDHLTHDHDPEEYYGVLSADRAPKPAYHEVREMYLEGPAPVGRAGPRPVKRWIFLACLGAIFVYTAYVFWPQRREQSP